LYYGYLSEPKATNSLLRSENYTTGWTLSAVTISADHNTAPDGLDTADGLIGTVATSAHYIHQTMTFSAGDYSVSAFIKAGSLSWAYISQAEGSFRCFFNLAPPPSVGTCLGGTTGKVDDFINGWVRAKIEFTSAGGAYGVYFGGALTDNNTVYTGDGTSIDVIVFGTQSEQSPAVTSYIKTTTTSVTREADALQYAVTGRSADNTRGTLWCDVLWIDNDRPLGSLEYPIMSIDDGTANNYVALNDNTGFEIVSGGVQQAAIGNPALADGTPHISIGTWQSGSAVGVTDEVSDGSDSSVTVPGAMNIIGIGMPVSTVTDDFERPSSAISRCKVIERPDYFRQSQ
jgi:hypothetical protein